MSWRERLRYLIQELRHQLSGDSVESYRELRERDDDIIPEINQLVADHLAEHVQPPIEIDKRNCSHLQDFAEVERAPPGGGIRAIRWTRANALRPKPSPTVVRLRLHGPPITSPFNSGTSTHILGGPNSFERCQQRVLSVLDKWDRWLSQPEEAVEGSPPAPRLQQRYDFEQEWIKRRPNYDPVQQAHEMRKAYGEKYPADDQVIAKDFQNARRAAKKRKNPTS